jgi:hypothetical protein
MKTHSNRLRRGFTLIELAIAMMMGMATGGMVIALFNQQLAFLRIYQAQDFLTQEAPVVSMHVSKIIGEADRFRLHDSVQDALAGSNPKLSNSPVLALNYRMPDGAQRAAILSFEDRGEGPALYYYLVPLTGPLGTPEWFITNQAADVTFSIDNGVLRMQLTGHAGERITYSGTMQQ